MDIVAFPVNGRTAAENLLQSAYRDGRPLDLTRTRIRHDTRVLSGDPDRVIRAEVIRNLVLSDAPGSPGRIRQIDITGALVLGPLDLRFADINCPIRFRRLRLRQRCRPHGSAHAVRISEGMHVARHPGRPCLGGW